ncbi:hypothetical protein CC85DRAFT_309288 [Cutaneotrichosporon oleaginosum]|uniref:MARVEL domain-containing protein n=1 Tax=Cutaneotrichosporon oleaginosum TaxID=879819 RepID=A0A0J0XF67_9TREE|nr:uncharacterized protein CC85DRAFT_309288 [Cutaneotrichosporon oleaginosum]KLT39725.1 hypothetical protein CC85DRAFT_309288 [Cutaneotrichosporon oleaginosum]
MMQRLKETRYKLAGALVSSKDNDGGGLHRLRNGNDDDSVPAGTYRNPSLSKPNLILHSVAIFFTFLAICTMAAVAAFQGKWFSVSGGTGFTLFLLLLDFTLLIALLSIPLIYDRWDKGRRPAQFLSQARAAFILHVFGTILQAIAAFVVTISAWSNPGCKNPDDDKRAEDLGDDYKNGLGGWCRTKKASGIIGWLALAAWIGLLILSGLAFREDRRNHKEPSFIPPSSPGALESGMGRPYDPVGDDDVFADKYEASPAPRLDDAYAQPRPYAHGRPGVLAQQEQTAMSRPSVDAYGAFDGDMPGAHAHAEPSRTMQMAYNDPYADLRAQVVADGGFGHPTPPPQHYPSPSPAPGRPAYPGY